MTTATTATTTPPPLLTSVKVHFSIQNFQSLKVYKIIIFKNLCIVQLFKSQVKVEWLAETTDYLTFVIQYKHLSSVLFIVHSSSGYQQSYPNKDLKKKNASNFKWNWSFRTRCTRNSKSRKNTHAQCVLINLKLWRDWECTSLMRTNREQSQRSLKVFKPMLVTRNSNLRT